MGDFWGRFPPYLCRNFGLVNLMTQPEKFVVHSTTTGCILKLTRVGQKRDSRRDGTGEPGIFFQQKIEDPDTLQASRLLFFFAIWKKSGSFFLCCLKTKNPPGQCVAWDAGKQRKLTQLSGRGDEISSISQVFGYRWFVLEVRWSFRDENPTHRSLNNAKLLVGKWVENGRLLPPFPKGLFFCSGELAGGTFFCFPPGIGSPKNRSRK